MNCHPWLEERSRLNHDILQNQVLTEFKSLNSDPLHTRPLRLMSWLKQVTSYKQFFDRTEEALDASRLLDAPLFSCWPSLQREAYRSLFRDIFNTYNRVPDRIRTLNELLQHCIEGATAFLNTPTNERNTQQVVMLELNFAQLSKTISELPHPVGLIAANCKGAQS